MKRLGDKIVVNNANNMVEQRRLEWTTYSNIDFWFDTLKVFLVEKGFARHKILGEDHVAGELVYFEHQTHRIMNLDESKASTDETTKIAGGHPATKWRSSDGYLPKGSRCCNKSGYSLTFIGGSMVSGWPLPCHIQSKSNAFPENQMLNINWLKKAPSVRGCTDLVKLLRKELALAQIQRQEWMLKNSKSI